MVYEGSKDEILSRGDPRMVTYRNMHPPIVPYCTGKGGAVNRPFSPLNEGRNVDYFLCFLKKSKKSANFLSKTV